MIQLNRKAKTAVGILAFIGLFALLINIHQMSNRIDDLESTNNIQANMLEYLESDLSDKKIEIESLRSDVSNLQMR